MAFTMAVTVTVIIFIEAIELCQNSPYISIIKHRQRCRRTCAGDLFNTFVQATQ